MDLRRQQQRSIRLWNILGKKLPQTEVVFFSQVILLYIVILTCIVNLSLNVENSNLWICLMSSCLGYLLPNPKIENGTKTGSKQIGHDEPDVSHPPQQ